MSGELVLTNARIVLADEIVQGTVSVRSGRIDAVDASRTAIPSAVDLEGGTLIPGLIELHTDNIERHLMPRPKADWPSEAAVMSHDREVVASGITTVCNALAVGAVNTHAIRETMLLEICRTVDGLDDSGALKADHFLHLRCEVSYPSLPGLIEPVIDHPAIRIISVMDHTPGQRQFADIGEYASFYKGRFGLNDAELERFMKERQADQIRYSATNRSKVVELGSARGISLASHDDATEDHVDEAISDGIVIAEFPTTKAAAKKSHENGLAVLMGGPNMVRGRSHNGNISARDLAEAGTLDILSSDYIPASLLYAALVMERSVDDIALPQAIATVTRNPARQISLDDRGEIAVGKRADLVHFRETGGVPVIQNVWREGRLVA
ncbi:MAG: alpha-D-ribose 1-methylphosphonate 5-triphosphate diphosphatase [Hyphomicrobiaceae bacterium]|nr:alpha-D-ribose 1-methylphosphonate 5-triphosphate diphosphatase [Hyphomicrobiaceae bacterium]